jgi:hypothetical protein
MEFESLIVQSTSKMALICEGLKVDYIETFDTPEVIIYFWSQSVGEA